MSWRFVKISKGLLLLPASAVVVFCISQYYKVQTADSAAFMEEKLFGNQRNSFTPYSASTGKSMKEDNYAEMLDKLNRKKIVQEDPRLIKLIQDHFVEPPSTRPYNLKNPKKRAYTSKKSKVVDQIMNNMVGVAASEQVASFTSFQRKFGSV